ncbi:MAG: hypothetical protein JRI72_00535 [Deltaproteobacteria bacterium]|nr:hypothetical protein [Deltaproteobacteria bacterium]
MGTPKRFLNGIATVSSGDPLGALPYADPTKWVMYFEDFVGPLFNTTSINNTSVTENGLSVVASANGTVSIVTDSDSPNGCLKVVTTAADNESGLIQTISPGWVLTSDKKFLMEVRFEITHTAGNIEQNELFLGLASYQTGANFFATAGTTRTFDDGIGWYSPDADTDIDLICGENDSFDNVTVKATYATATWYTMSMYYDGTDIYTWVNGTDSGSLTPSAIPVSVVGPTFYFKSGEAKVHQLLVDYLFCAKER